jgi:hypothetical protein
MIAVLVIASSALIVCTPALAVSDDGYYHREFEWYYAGLRWTWSLDISKSLYNMYQDVTDAERVRNGPAGYGYLATTHDSYIVMLANKLNESAVKKGYEPYDEISFILAFVQSLPYTSDSVTTEYDEYPRFPVETLVDGGGDCEDTSILFATITLILNYDTIFINPPNHFAVGVWGRNLTGSYYTYHDRTYYYCETTGNDWRIGQIPDNYKGISAYLYTINENTQYEPRTSSTGGFLGSWEFLAIGIGITALLATGIVLLLYTASKKRSVGKETKQTPSVQPNSIVYCRYCGSENRSDATFCQKCGKRI